MAPVTQKRGTAERLLDAAEELLVESDYEAVSVRGICARAGANPAAVHYHYGSKEQLIAALLEARLGPVWNAGLDDAVAQPTVPGLVEAILAPLNALLADPLGGLRLSLLSRFVLSHPQVRWQTTWFSLDRWVRALRAALPGLDEATARRRCLLAFSLLLGQFAPGKPLPEPALAALGDFLVAGLTGAPR